MFSPSQSQLLQRWPAHSICRSKSLSAQAPKCVIYPHSLDHTDTRHLHRKLKNDAQCQPAEVGRIDEELCPSRLQLALEFDGSLELGCLGQDKEVGDIASGMKTSQGLNGVLFTTDTHKPPRRFGEQEDERGKRQARNDLQAESKAPLKGLPEKMSAHAAVADATLLETHSITMVHFQPIHNKAGNKGANAEEELLKRRQASSDGRVR